MKSKPLRARKVTLTSSQAAVQQALVAESEQDLGLDRLQLDEVAAQPFSPCPVMPAPPSPKIPTMQEIVEAAQEAETEDAASMMVTLSDVRVRLDDYVESLDETSTQTTESNVPLETTVIARGSPLEIRALADQATLEAARVAQQHLGSECEGSSEHVGFILASFRFIDKIEFFRSFGPGKVSLVRQNTDNHYRKVRWWVFRWIGTNDEQRLYFLNMSTWKVWTSNAVRYENLMGSKWLRLKPKWQAELVETDPCIRWCLTFNDYTLVRRMEALSGKSMNWKPIKASQPHIGFGAVKI